VIFLRFFTGGSFTTFAAIFHGWPRMVSGMVKLLGRIGSIIFVDWILLN